MKDTATGLLIGGIIFCCIFGASLLADMGSLNKGDRNIWWTHKDMMLSLPAVKDKVEIYISGKPLAGLVDRGSLVARTSAGDQYKVASRDIGIRLNNWDRQRVSLLKKALVSAFGFGAGIALLVAGLYMKFSVKQGSHG
ncbi:MAG TPA: hypothetical protein PLJ26_00530 [Candidatus Omnitrophota bacterium]|nr:hypothetical protein [Candidatus Omnitrophota bacterium]HQJ14958.1 hypothetical protein [Candidatus Omnitrophota bacterium]